VDPQLPDGLNVYTVHKEEEKIWWSSNLISNVVWNIVVVVLL
jgi:hypothetical protein